MTGMNFPFEQPLAVNVVFDRRIEHGQRETELAALVQIALHPDPPAHHLDQFSSDGQPQARPAKLARGRAVRLTKLVKNDLLVFRPDADSRIGDVVHTSRSAASGASRSDTVTLPCRVNLSALLNRLVRICWTRLTSPRTGGRPSERFQAKGDDRAPPPALRHFRGTRQPHAPPGAAQGRVPFFRRRFWQCQASRR